MTIMQWKDILTRKRKDILILTSILLMMLLILVINRKHLSELRDSVTSVYEDRLVAEDYIFRLSQHIHETMNHVHYDHDLSKTTQAINNSINTLICSYEATELTQKESLYLKTLKIHISKLQLYERQLMTSNSKTAMKAKMEIEYSRILSHLDKLSQIQLVEGKKTIDHAQKIIASSNVTLRLEISLLIILSLVVYAISYYSKSKNVQPDLHRYIASNLN